MVTVKTTNVYTKLKYLAKKEVYRWFKPSKYAPRVYVPGRETINKISFGTPERTGSAGRSWAESLSASTPTE